MRTKHLLPYNQRKFPYIRISFYLLILACTSITLPSCKSNEPQQGTMSFTVTMDQPSTHYFHVEFTGDGIRGDYLDFKMPAWTPGYYMILDLAKYVFNFQAVDGPGNNLNCEKVNKNTWRVATHNSPSVKISYDVYAYVQSVGNPFLDDGRGFLSPTGMFMYVDGFLDHPVTVKIEPYREWHSISAGLDPVEGMGNTFFAPDFDILYDCPILTGNQEIRSFEVQGIPHFVAMENPPDIDMDQYMSDLKKMVESAVAIIGEIPYKHYTFIIMDQGMGGLEHSNSQAVFSGSRYSLNDPQGYKRWQAFIAHEYFHLFNVKRIRPIALGPFDYDRENYTHMLWLSEGVTVYYEYIILNHAGFLSREESLELLRKSITNYEYIPGHLFQPVTMSSFDTWIQFFNRSENASSTTISYYDKGCALGMLLDLKIRHETKNEKSFDDVMRTLYYNFHKKQNRGFTDQEFQDVCENFAGCPLDEIFEFASTTKNVDYAKYLAYAGLNIDTVPEKLPGVFLGANMREVEGNLVINSVEWDSPAWHAGLSARDNVIELNGQKASPDLLNKILGSGTPGDKLAIKVSRRTGEKVIEVILKEKKQPGFKITPMTDPEEGQLSILNDWLIQ